MSDNSKILVVDDEALIGMALADELENSGFEVVGPYCSVEEARSSLDKKMPDAAFLDVNLGRGRTSYGLAAELLEKGVPVTFVTGYRELTSTDERFADADYLAKPVSPKQAVTTANRMLAKVTSE